ncbi:MAG: hypothetical protein ABR610_01350 [Thermoanaerobaculia bacterium]
MTNVENRKVRLVWSLVLFLVAGAATLHGISPREGVHPRRDGKRRAALLQIRSLEPMYGDFDLSLIRDTVASNPEGEGNAELMTVPIALGNLYLNEYELRGSRSHFQRALDAIEWVATNDALWSGRRASGTVAAYLELTLTRFADECDVGSTAARIATLKERVDEVLSREAASRLGNGIAGEEPSENEADSAALFAAASSFLPSAGAEAWETESRSTAGRALTSCPTSAAMLSLSQGALMFSLTGHPIPPEFQQIPILSPGGQSRVVCSGSGARRRPIRLMDIGRGDDREDKLSRAVANSWSVVQALSGSFLWHYSPGLECSDDSLGEGPPFERFWRLDR